MRKKRHEIMFHSSPGSLTQYLSPQLEGTGKGGLGQMTLKSLLLYDSTDHSLPPPPRSLPLSAGLGFRVESVGVPRLPHGKRSLANN